MMRGIRPLIGFALLAAAGVALAVAEPSSANAAKAPASKCNRATFRVILDVGHTAQEPGATSARGVPEYDFNLRLARRIETKLLEAGFARTVLLVMAGPNWKELPARVARANAMRGELLVSIHHDSVPEFLLASWQYEGVERRHSDSFKGHALFISDKNREARKSLAFARLLGLRLKAAGMQYTPHYTDPIMGRRRRVLLDRNAGVYRFDELIVLKDTKVPAVLLEAGSIVHRDEELAMSSGERQSLIAAALAAAVEEFCKVPRRRS
jgi:N-acetylmuramoyl-L-alanine amidase